MGEKELRSTSLVFSNIVGYGIEDRSSEERLGRGSSWVSVQVEGTVGHAEGEVVSAEGGAGLADGEYCPRKRYGGGEEPSTVAGRELRLSAGW
ncbi:unnamed protein product [Linum trigynum]|uniref:Uncharacterized protein n=1 Tax=Linum trigynum TaxID=586398 RepID=A0AAV2G599_9ROSI